MRLAPSALVDTARSPAGKKLIRYTTVSLIAVVCNVVILSLLVGGLEWSGARANVVAVAMSAIPSYVLNRRWTWGKSGRSHLMKEVVPFWAMAFLGLALSTLTVHWAELWIEDHDPSRLMRTVVLDAANLGAFGVLWAGKFVVLNKVLFAHHPEDLEDAPALDGRTGIPT